jgi:bifunctional non-homologous end joining protein LigD
MLATLVPAPFDREGWVYEEKYDGIRALAYREAKRVRLISRNLNDITAQFSEIARALEPLPGGDIVLDGELVAFDAHEVSRFQLLQRRELGEPARPAYAIFDCLEHGGVELLRRPLRERRAALEEIVPSAGGPLLRARRIEGGGLAAFRTAQRRGWEGILAKDEASRYEPGHRSRSWLKVKCRKQSEFVVGGFTTPKGRRHHFGALLLGLYEGARLRYVGRVGTGFPEAMLASLGAELVSLRTAASPFEAPPREAGATWVEPKLVAEIRYAEWTADGKLRQPAFVGLRHDKTPDECTWAERER